MCESAYIETGRFVAWIAHQWMNSTCNLSIVGSNLDANFYVQIEYQWIYEIFPLRTASPFVKYHHIGFDYAFYCFPTIWEWENLRLQHRLDMHSIGLTSNFGYLIKNIGRITQLAQLRSTRRCDPGPRTNFNQCRLKIEWMWFCCWSIDPQKRWWQIKSAGGQKHLKEVQ